MKVWLVTLNGMFGERNLHAAFAKKEDASAEMKKRAEWLEERGGERIVVLEEADDEEDAALVISEYDDSGEERIVRAAMLELEVIQ